MATPPYLQPEICELGRGLNLILSGERKPNLRGMHSQLAQAVKKALQDL